MEFDKWIDNQKCLLQRERDEEVAQQHEMLASAESTSSPNSENVDRRSVLRHAVFRLPSPKYLLAFSGALCVGCSDMEEKQYARK